MNIDEGESEGAETVFAISNGLLQDGVTSSGSEWGMFSTRNEDGTAAVENGFRCTFDEKSTCAIVVHQDGHHLTVTRELEGEETGNGTFVVVVDSAGTDHGREGRERRSKLLVGATNFLGEDFESSFSRFSDIGVGILLL